MSDTVLALGITVLLLAALAAWVPLLHMAARLTKKNDRYVARELPVAQQPASLPPSRIFDREIAR